MHFFFKGFFLFLVDSACVRCLFFFGEQKVLKGLSMCLGRKRGSRHPGKRQFTQMEPLSE